MSGVKVNKLGLQAIISDPNSYPGLVPNFSKWIGHILNCHLCGANEIRQVIIVAHLAKVESFFKSHSFYS